MAVKYPSANGLWSTAANWNGGTLPQTGDTVCANGKTIVIDMDLAAYSFVSLTTLATAPAAAGGGFTCAIDCTINANLNAGINNLLTTTGVGTTVNIIGNLVGSPSAGYHALVCSAIMTINITGNFTGGAYNALGISCTAAATINITGIGTGGVSGNTYGLNCTSTATITVTGTIISSATCPAIYSTANCNVYVTGIIDTQTPPTAVIPAITLTTGTLYFSGSIRNRSAIMAIGVKSLVLLSTGPTTWYMVNEIAGSHDLYTTDTAMFGYPAPQDTRDMTVYGQANEFTGVYKVAPQSSVLTGVPNDNGVGTFVPGGATAADVWDYLLTSILTSGSIGKLIKDNLDAPISGITGTTPAQIWDYLLTAILTPGSIGKTIKDNLDVVVSSRSVLTAQQVWDVLLTSLVTPGSIGKLLVDDIDTKLSDLPTLFWSKVIDGTYTADKVLKIMASILAGKTVIVDTGNNTATVTFRNLDDTSDVVKANMDSSERITMTLTP